MKGVFRKVDDKTLVAASAEAMEALAAVHRGHDCMADVRGARNVEQFNLFWKMMGLVATATDSTKEACKEWLMVKTNYVDLIWLPDGSMHLKPKSVSWEKMEQAKFAEFFNIAIPAISGLLQVAPKDLIAEFESLLNPDERAHYRKIKKLMPVDSPSVVPDHEREREEQTA